MGLPALVLCLIPPFAQVIVMERSAKAIHPSDAIVIALQWGVMAAKKDQRLSQSIGRCFGLLEVIGGRSPHHRLETSSFDGITYGIIQLA